MSAIVKKLQKVIEDKNQRIEEVETKLNSEISRRKVAEQLAAEWHDETDTLKKFKGKYEETLTWGIALENELEDLKRAIEELS